MRIWRTYNNLSFEETIEAIVRFPEPYIRLSQNFETDNVTELQGFW